MTFKFNTLVMSGGGLKGIPMLGSLQYLIDMKHIEIKNIKKYVGTSIGAIINVLLIIGYEPKEIIAEMIQSKYLENIKVTPFSGLSGKGFLNFEKITELLEKLICKKMKRIPTIQEFCHQYNIIFLAISFNYTTQQEFTISVKNSPNLNLLDALHMSSNVPFLFEPFEYEGNQFFDGFLTNNYPINKLNIDQDTAIGITHSSSGSGSTSMTKWNLFWDIILIPLNQLQKTKRDPYQDHLLNITINITKLFDWDYNLDIPKILDQYSDGFLQTKSMKILK